MGPQEHLLNLVYVSQFLGGYLLKSKRSRSDLYIPSSQFLGGYLVLFTWLQLPSRHPPLNSLADTWELAARYADMDGYTSQFLGGYLVVFEMTSCRAYKSYISQFLGGYLVKAYIVVI